MCAAAGAEVAAAARGVAHRPRRLASRRRVPVLPPACFPVYGKGRFSVPSFTDFGAVPPLSARSLQCQVSDCGTDESLNLAATAAGRAWRTPFGSHQHQSGGGGLDGPVAHAVVLQLPLDGPLQAQGP